MKEAKSIIVQSKAKAWEQIQAKQAVTASTIEIIMHEYQSMLAREQHDNNAAMAATSMHHKENLDNVRTFKMMQKQVTLDNLRDEVMNKKNEVTCLNWKWTLHCMEQHLKRKSWGKSIWRKSDCYLRRKKNQKRQTQKNEDKDWENNIFEGFSNDINYLKSEIYTTKRDSRDLKQMKLANTSLANNWLEKVRKLKLSLSELKLELDNLSACWAEVEEALSNSQVRITFHWWNKWASDCNSKCSGMNTHWWWIHNDNSL